MRLGLERALAHLVLSKSSPATNPVSAQLCKGGWRHPGLCHLLCLLQQGQKATPAAVRKKPARPQHAGLLQQPLVLTERQGVGSGLV